MIRNIIFDIGRVLIGFDWRSYLKSRYDEKTADAVGAAIWGSGYWPELDRAVLSVEEILALFISVQPDYEKEIRDAFEGVGGCVSKREWPVSLIRELKDKGYGVYFLSNYSEHVMNANRGALDFISSMDGGVFSCDVKMIKPDPGIYRCLLDKYSLAAEECLFIDDKPENTAAAKAMGFKTIVFSDYEQLHADLYKALQKDSTHDRITVLCYGDSNTYGYDPLTGGRYPYEKRWTTILGEMLGGRYEVISEGLNGRTTAYDRPGAAWKNGMSSFVACLGTHKPVDCIVIMLGTNDCNDELGLTAQDIALGMETLIRTAEKEAPGLQGYVPEIIVTVPAAIGENYKDSPFAGELTPKSVQNSRDIGPLYREIAERHRCMYASAIDTAEVSPCDCTHLSERGHRQMAELIYKTIKQDL